MEEGWWSSDSHLKHIYDPLTELLCGCVVAELAAVASQQECMRLYTRAKVFVSTLEKPHKF